MRHALVAPILLVEDDPNDVLFVRHALEAALIQNPLEVFDSAEPAYEYLGRHTARLAPVLIILDMNLAGPETGLDVLTWIRRQPEPLGSTAVLMLTGSGRQEDRNASGRLGAIDFLQKPVTVQDLTMAVQALGFAVVNNSASEQLGIHIVKPHPVPEFARAETPPSGTEPDRFRYVRDDVRRRIRVTAKTPLSAADLAAIVERQAAEGTWAFDMLYDLRAIQGATTRADSIQVSALVRRYVAEHGRRGRVAVVTREIAMLGIAQGYAYDGQKAGVDVQVFWDLDEAENWLGQVD